MVRARLDADGGGRAKWLSALLPIAGLPLAVPAAAAATGVVGGVLAMSNGTKVGAAVLVSLIITAVGFWLVEAEDGLGGGSLSEPGLIAGDGGAGDGSGGPGAGAGSASGARGDAAGRRNDHRADLNSSSCNL